ncbi:MAG: toll/interleukin-1 receptor domain-containing protein [bacterium]|nr:toll/interleukin-1 receptor domain-containing protein [bacterium]
MIRSETGGEEHHYSRGFWSYVRRDDEIEGGRISALAALVQDQYELLTGGEKLPLFLDRDAIEWGQHWKTVIDKSLASTTFFIPVLTPAYFESPECRRELQEFIRKAKRLGYEDLLMPLLYVNVPGFPNELSQDPLIRSLRQFQYEDWTELSLADPSSPQHRKGVRRLALRLRQANQDAGLAEGVSTTPQIDLRLEEGMTNDSPGLLDRLAKAEEALPKSNDILRLISQDINLIGQIMTEGTACIKRADQQGKGFAARLVTVRRVASQLDCPTQRIWEWSNEYASHLHDINTGFRDLIERAPAEVQENPDSQAGFCDFFRSVTRVSAAASAALESIQKMIDACAPLKGMSRDLRPPLRRLEKGLTIMVEGGQVMNEWVQLIQASGIICSETDD